MEEMVDDILNSKDDVYTPERIAWQLLVGEVDECQKGMEILSVGRDSGNIHTFVYEILITIFMELLFNLAKLGHYSKNENKKFIPDYEKLEIDALLSVVSDKMILLKYIARVNTYEKTEIDPDEFKTLANARYCRVVLRYYDEDPFFDQNIADDLYYHMKLNGLKEREYKKLSDIYCLIVLPDKVYTVAFTHLYNII